MDWDREMRQACRDFFSTWSSQCVEDRVATCGFRIEPAGPGAEIFNVVNTCVWHACAQGQPVVLFKPEVSA